MDMTIKYSKIITMLLVVIMTLTILAPTAFAEEAPSIEIPVSVKLSGQPPADDEDYRINFKSDNPDYPMPAASENGVFTMIITGEDTVKLPAIKYSSLGVYTYIIEQEAGSNELASYDDVKYNLVVYVTNAEGGSGLETTVRLYLLGEMDKLGVMEFNNEYEEPERPPLPDTGGDPPPQAPETPEPAPPATVVERPKLPQTSDDTAIWPYVGLFISGAAMIFLLGMTIKKRSMEE